MGSLKDKEIKVPNGTYVTFTSDNENMIMTPKVTQSGTVLYFSADNGFGESTGGNYFYFAYPTVIPMELK